MRPEEYDFNENNLDISDLTNVLMDEL